MHETTLGKLVTAEHPRDAIHIAVAPARAIVRLRPGQRVGFTKPGNILDVGPVADKDVIGIVDPWLTADVLPGLHFLLCLTPKSITGLTHCWTHPAYDMALLESFGPSTESVAWLQHLAAELETTYEALVEAAATGRGMTFNTSGYEAVYEDEFWAHVEAVCGKVLDRSRRQASWSCSC